VNWTVYLQDRAVGGKILFISNGYFYIFLKWCVLLDCYKLIVFTKRRKRKLFTGR